jgi:hypothetical protein
MENKDKKKQDEYHLLRKALRDGKRVVFKDSNGKWVDINDEVAVSSVFHVSRYKIVDRDEYYKTYYLTSYNLQIVILKVTKSGINGKISVEVIDQNADQSNIAKRK